MAITLLVVLGLFSYRALGVDPARPGADREDGVVIRVGIPEKQLQLALLELAIDHGEIGRHLPRQLLVAVGQLTQLDQVASPRLQARPRLQLAAQLGRLARDAAGAPGIVPDARSA